MASAHIHPADIRGFGRLVIHATTGITDMVEAVHHTITLQPRPADPAAPLRTRGITGFVYQSVRNVTQVVGGALDLSLAPVVALLDQLESTEQREALLAALNGVLGDQLAATHNPLAIKMTLRQHDPAAFDPYNRRIIVFAHGLCMNDRQWARQGDDQSRSLAADLGYTPFYLHYNSGLHIAANGHAFAKLLEDTLAAWPELVDELVIVGHSMGGLLARSAYHYATAANMQWPRLLRKLVFLGTPHHGSPLERGGNWIDVVLTASPFLAPLARLGQIRSAGITDLRYGNLRDEDKASPDRFARTGDARQPLPLPKGVQCYAAAAVMGKRTANLKGALLGDGLVPLDSALGRHVDPRFALAIPPAQQWVRYDTGHLELLWRPEVFAQVREWLS
jgi:pimeloyl-ACP methyl ester carboxylesterase